MTSIDLTSYDSLRLQFADGILTATLHNPTKLNAIDPGTQHDLDRIWRDVDEDEGIRAVILTGEGSAFCSGVDMTELTGDDALLHREKAAAKRIRDRIFDIVDCETPVIAKVRGPAYGLGLSYALACDFVVAAEDAQFCDSHIKNGITAGDGCVALVPLAIGLRRAKEMLMLGEPISGLRAAEIGLINQSVPEAELDAAVSALAHKLSSGPPRALSWTKLSLNTVMKQAALGALEISIAYDLLSLRTDDVREGARAFAEKRPPHFTGF